MTQGGNDSGGIISNTSGDGIVLVNATNVTLNNMTIGSTAAAPAHAPNSNANITGDGIQATSNCNGLTLNYVTIAETGDHGVNAAGLSNLTINGCLILNAGNGNEEHGLNLDEQRGENFVTGSLFDAFNETGIELTNASGTVDLTVSGTTFQDNKATVGNFGEEAILVTAQGTAQIFVLVNSNCVFDQLSSQGVQGISEGASSDLHMTILDSSFLESNAGDALIISNPDNAGDAWLRVHNCTLTDATFGPFGVIAKNDSSGVSHATLTTVNAPKVQLINHNHDDTGSGGPANGTSFLHVEGCTNLVGSENIGADLISTEGIADGASPDVSITMVNNNIQATDEGIFSFIPGMRILSQGVGVHHNHIDIRGNTLVGAPDSSGANGLSIQEFDASETRIENLTGGAAAFLDGLNTIGNGSAVPASVNTAGNATTPTLPTLP
ncbi:MAG: right-handed parallel beta-helix repeat-containing protein [Verrucomicrobiales bacterium]